VSAQWLEAAVSLGIIHTVAYAGGPVVVALIAGV